MSSALYNTHHRDGPPGTGLLPVPAESADFTEAVSRPRTHQVVAASGRDDSPALSLATDAQATAEDRPTLPPGRGTGRGSRRVAQH
jgi:hypothetical protein